MSCLWSQVVVLEEEPGLVPGCTHSTLQAPVRRAGFISTGFSFLVQVLAICKSDSGTFAKMPTPMEPVGGHSRPLNPAISGEQHPGTEATLLGTAIKTFISPQT